MDWTQLARDLVVLLEVLRVGGATLDGAQVRHTADLARLESGGHGKRLRGQASRGAPHEVGPDRQRYSRAGAAADDPFRLIEADPHANHHRRVETDEPRIVVIVRRTGFAADCAVNAPLPRT